MEDRFNTRLRLVLCFVMIVSGFMTQMTAWEHGQQASEYIARTDHLSSLPSSNNDWNEALANDPPPQQEEPTTPKTPTGAPTYPWKSPPTNSPNVPTNATEAFPNTSTNNENPKQQKNIRKGKRKNKNNNNALDLGKLQDPNKPPSAAICTIVRDENKYLEEWAMFHLALGFEKIYLYDNSDHGSAGTWLQNTVARTNNTILEQGVHVHPFPTKDNKRQLKAFRGCIEKFGIHHTWVALYDPDEFLVLKKHENIVDFLDQHCPNGSLGINWVIFGTSNETVYDPSIPVTKRFQLHTGVDGHVKTIVKVADYKGQKSAHWVQLADPKMRKDTNGNWIKGQRFAGVNNPTFHLDGPTNLAALHHYKYKSLEEFNSKGCSRGYVWNQQRCFNENLEDLPAGHIYDDSAWKLLQRLLPGYYASAKSTLP